MTFITAYALVILPGTPSILLQQALRHARIAIQIWRYDNDVENRFGRVEDSCPPNLKLVQCALFSIHKNHHIQIRGVCL